MLAVPLSLFWYNKNSTIIASASALATFKALSKESENVEGNPDLCLPLL